MPLYNCIVILGPTASGKTALSIWLAKKFGGVVISADSRQVYRGMDIGTGKITKKEMSGVPHFLLDVASPRGQYSISRFADDVRRTLQRVKVDQPIFLVGGSAFYINAVTKPGAFSNVPPNPALRKKLEKKSTAQLVALLQRKAPSRIESIDQHNRRRLIRAIEIASTKNIQRSPALPPMRFLRIGIRVPRETLINNIDRRVDQRLRQGMVAEVSRLHRQGVSWKRLDAFGLEYRYISRYLRGHMTKPAMVYQLKSAIHDFAKRQMTWWKHDQEIHWITTQSQARTLIKKFLLPPSR